MNLELLCNRLLAALLNGGYQGLLLAGVVWLGLKLVPRTNAATRHAIWFSTLLAVSGLPVLHLLLPKWLVVDAPVVSGPTSAARTDTSVADGDGGIGLAAKTAPAAIGPVLPRIATETADAAGVGAEWATGSPSSGEVPDQTGNQVADAPEFDSTTIARAGIVGSTVGSPSAVADWRLKLPAWTGEVLVGLWALLAVIRLGMLGRQCAELKLLKRTAVVAPDELCTLFSRLSREMELKRGVRLMLGAGDVAPMAVGFRRPAVVLPAAIARGAADAQVTQLLRHELAHLVRGDDWANLIQQTIHAILFFHPAVWWISRRMTLEREVACDDHVLAFTSAPRAYALFLTEFAGRTLTRRVAAAPAAWNHTHQLQERIAMILDSKRNACPRLARASVGLLSTGAALFAVAALFAGPRLALAEDKPATVKAPTGVVIALPAPEVAEAPEDASLPPAPAIVALPATPGLPPQPRAALVLVGPSAANALLETEPRPKPAPRKASAGVAANAPRPMIALVAPAAGLPAVVAVPAPGGFPGPGSPQFALNEDRDELPNRPNATPYPPREKRVPRDPNDSIERRLDRLERMVEELVARDKRPRVEISKEVSRDWNPKVHVEIDHEKMAKLAEDMSKIAEKAQKAGLSEADAARIKDQVKRDLERAARDVERATRDAQRATASARADGERGGKFSNERHELEMQRQQLEAERRGVEKQLEALERRIDRLDEAREKLRERDAHEKQAADDAVPAKPKGPSTEDDGSKPKIAK